MKSVNELKTKEDKAFFIEKISIYIRLVECYALKMNLQFVETTLDDDITKELINIGFIKTSDEIYLLQQSISSNIFSHLLECVLFAINHENEMHKVLFKLREKDRAVLREKEKKRKAPTLVDFFCGAGGLSYGFKRAGYKILLSNDIQNVCCETYRYNHPEMDEKLVVNGDIKEIVNNIDKYIHDDVDVVIGGPPCQGFSSANQQRVIDDQRNKLYKYYIEAVQKLAPKIVVMENVRGMLSVADQVVEDYGRITAIKDGRTYHYTASYKLLDSQYFGVAQSRVRLIYIAIRDDIANKHNTIPENIYNAIEESCRRNTIHNLCEALDCIKPLVSPRVKNRTEIDDEHTGKKIDINAYEGYSNLYLDSINEGRDMPFVFNHKARYASDANYEIFRRLEQGEDGTSPNIEGLMPYERRRNIFKDKYYKLIADRPCRTITAHLRMDCLSHIHPYQIRTITPREAARIQSFPDDYFFLGAYLKTYMQIGNAVPVLMAKQIAESIRIYLL